MDAGATNRQPCGHPTSAHAGLLCRLGDRATVPCMKSGRLAESPFAGLCLLAAAVVGCNPEQAVAPPPDQGVSMDLVALADLAPPPDMTAPAPTDLAMGDMAPLPADAWQPEPDLLGFVKRSLRLEAGRSLPASVRGQLMGPGFAPVYPEPLLAADLNSDGKLAIVASILYPGVEGPSTLLGNGDATFRAPVSSWLDSSASVLALADLDGDQRVDAVTVHYGRDKMGNQLGALE